MQKLAALVAGAVLLWLSLAAGPAGLEVAAHEWEYRWEVRADGTSQVWRRPAGEPAGDWVPAGIVPQEVVDIVSNQLQPGLAVARTSQALFHTQDAGRQWQQMSGLPDWPTAVALGTEQAGLIYLGTLTGGVYRSIDAGTTWQPLPWDLEMMSGTFLEVTALAVHPRDDDVVYAAAGHWLGSTEQSFTPSGIAVSLDAGTSWHVFYRAELNDPRVTGLEPDPEEPLRVLARSQEGDRWLTMEGASLPEQGLRSAVAMGSQSHPVPARQADSAGVQAAGRQTALPDSWLRHGGVLLLSVAGLVVVGAGLHWVLRWRGCSLHSLRH